MALHLHEPQQQPQQQQQQPQQLQQQQQQQQGQLRLQSASDSGSTLSSALERTDALAHDNDDDDVLLRPLHASSSADNVLVGRTANASGSASGDGSISSDVEREPEAGEDDADTAATAASPAAKRRRKRTYDTRKDEIDALAATAAQLDATLAFLKHRAGVQDAQSVAQTERQSAALREALETQQLRLAGARSMLSADSSHCVLNPVSTPIHLPRDLAQRRAALSALKPQKLHDARRFLEKRTQALHPTARWSESTRLDDCRGDPGVVKLDVVPLRRATSVQHAFDAVMFYFANLEICSTEALGDVTVRQDIDGEVGGESETESSSSSSCSSGRSTADGSSSDGIAQHRFVRQHRDHCAAAIETNSVLFAEYAPTHRCAQTGECREEAIVVTDFVDRDDRSPYRPRERVRKDITSILHLRRRETHATDAALLPPSSAAREQVVVLTMWYHATLRRRGDCAVPLERLGEMTDDTDRVFSATLRSVRNALEATGAVLA